MTPTRLSPRDAAALTLIVLIWGTNFAAMKIGLRDFGPMLLGTLRFTLASLPLLLFVRPPALPWRHVVGYGLTTGLGQFGFLFIGMSLGLPSGVASVVLQTQAFFTALLAAGLLGERITVAQGLGLVASTVGLVLIVSSSSAGVGHVPLVGFLCGLMAAWMWAVSNIVAGFARRHNPAYSPLAFIVWSSLAPVVPFMGLALWHEGAAATVHSLTHFSLPGLGAVLFIAVASTLVAYSLWAQLLRRHPAGRVAPFSLLVPVIGLLVAWLLFDERLTALQWLGVAVVGAGLVLGNFGERWWRGMRAASAPVSP